MKNQLFAFKVTTPVLFGYLAIGFGFGLLVFNAGYPWYISLLMSTIIYAGALQYAAVVLFVNGAGYTDIAVAALLINSRHLVYGISMLEKFKAMGALKPYLAFGLTDETYGLLTTIKIPEDLNRKKVYFYITLYSQLYWVVGSLIGYFVGVSVDFNFEGVGFALTALITVLLVEQWKANADKLPFIIALIGTSVGLFCGDSGHMLLFSFSVSIVILLLFRRKLEC